MKTMLIRNYSMMMIAWSMVLGGHKIPALVIGILACIMLCICKPKVICWQCLAISLFTYMALMVLLSGTNIPYFFPELYTYLAVVSINLAFSNYCLYFLRNKLVSKFMLVDILVIAVLSLIIFILPDELYTLFSKTSLYIMLAIIFLPYLISLMYCACVKAIKRKVYEHLLIIPNGTKIYINSKSHRRVVDSSY